MMTTTTPSEIRKRAEQAMVRCRKLAALSEEASGTRRTFLSPPMHDCHREITQWLEPLAIPVRVDAAGNLRASYPGDRAGAPILLVGSHLDTVPNAGAYDGVLGVALAVSLLESLDGRRLPFGIEVVGFSEEEGVRFGVPFIGSRALVGRLDEELLLLQDARGVSVRKAIEGYGLHPTEIPQAALNGNYLGYVEFHIEQGPVLEELNLPLGVVESIAGQSRVEFTFLGRSNHAGTTPMHLRYDTLAAAAEWITAVEHKAQSSTGLLATVGRIEAKPGATNVIAGETRVTLDVRHSSDKIRLDSVNNLIEQAQEIAERRRLTVQWHALMEQPAVPMNPFLVAEIERAIVKTGCKSHRMMSGAGHDAMILAEKVPAAMIFLRTPGGVSHDPAESVAVEDVEKAIECGLHLLEQLASAPAASSSKILRP
ncbi:MAG: allantoate amidohydrolase [Candidatus Sulfotelmatobacter sp.]|jgi:allantoate deiminase